MTATSVLNRVIGEICCDNPARILKETNKHVRILLNHHIENEELKRYDDGFDMALCYIKPGENKLIFSGAKIPLFIHKNGEVEIITGDKQGIGYKRSKEEFEYTNHEINIEGDETFYVTSDGYIDQLGEENRFGIAKNGFKKLIIENSNKTLEEQKLEFEELFINHKGKV